MKVVTTKPARREISGLMATLYSLQRQFRALGGGLESWRFFHLDVCPGVSLPCWLLAITVKCSDWGFFGWLMFLPIYKEADTPSLEVIPTVDDNFFHWSPSESGLYKFLHFFEWNTPWHDILHHWNGKAVALAQQHALKLWSEQSLQHHWKFAMHVTHCTHGMIGQVKWWHTCIHIP